ncbi:hypothetical protein CCR75_007930 [Bremia lactucae]|uniref:Pre-mRNA-splicing factor prp46 n=1 Tax=Bremia lactucae TaxID=4779 RepID=A0A976FII5_BRELC|nr:hypothetical protein CCR75_007930 [Bremia lactucae]
MVISATDAQQHIEASVLRTAEMFALANTSHEYVPRYDQFVVFESFKWSSKIPSHLKNPTDSKKARVRTKLNDTYLMDSFILMQKIKTTAGAIDSTSSVIEASTRAHPSCAGALTETAMNGHTVPSIPVISIDRKNLASAENYSFVHKVAEEAEKELALKKRKTAAAKPNDTSSAIVNYKKQTESAAQLGASAITRRRSTEVPKPQWHAPWKLKRVIAGHLGWVRSISVDPTNDWFVTGSADRTIKVWDLASGQLKLTLTGHINAIRGLEVSSRHPYLFSAGEDKKVLCWDLECNKVIRSYHGHLSGVFSLKVHPTLDILVTGGRDAVARVWDMRTKNQIHVLSGHQSTVWTIETQATDPQIITGSSDSTIKLWDLAAGKVMTTLTNHKKSVRAITKSPTDHTFMSGAADNMKKWEAKEGRFLRNFSKHNAIINSISINQDGVMSSCGDNGSMRFWDYQTGYCFQSHTTKAQPGSLDSETGIFASTFDRTGLRFITCEADKTIKMWQEDSSASEESHAIDMDQWTKDFTAPKRY